MSDPAAETGADPLRSLFRQEVFAHSALLTEGLAVLAVDPRKVEHYEGMERAARHIKSVALLVEIASAADLAQALADALAAARRDPVQMTSDRVSDLLKAVDLLRALAEFSVDSESAEPREAQIAAIMQSLGGPPPMPSAAVNRPAVSPPPPAPPPPKVVKQAPPPVVHDPNMAPLLELFREEVRSLCDTLSAGLVGLEASQGNARLIEPLMRAAHSIKGAARIVGLDPAVDVAHYMEELLVAVQRGTTSLSATDVDALLAATDLLNGLADADLATWADAHGEAAAQRVAAIKHRTLPTPAAAPEPAVELPAPTLAPPPPPRMPPPRVPLTLPPPPAVSPRDPAPAPEVHAAPEGERVLRVSAQSLTRLLSLAGESLVEARWLQPFARSMLKLKKFQDHLAEVLQDFERALQAPGAADRVPQLLDDAQRRLTECRHVLAERIEEFETHARRSDDLNSRLYREVIASRMRPFADGTHGLTRMVRDVARQLNKKVRFDVVGQETDVDRDILDKLEAPLGHILRNALDHGFEGPDDRIRLNKSEFGTLRLEARHHAGMLTVSVTDDGRGIDPNRLRQKVVDRGFTTEDLASRMSEAELFDFLFLPGFSTAESVSDISGRGVGLDVVQSMAQAVGGAVRVTSKAGIGTTFELQLPITLSVVRAVLVRISGDPYAFPLNRTDRLLRLPPGDVRMLEGKPHFPSDGRNIGLVQAHLVFGLPAGSTSTDELTVVLIGDRSHQYGLIVEGFLGEQDLVVRPLDPRLGKVPNVSAASILEDGSPVLIVDVDDVTRSVGLLVHEGKIRHRPVVSKTVKKKKRVLVVDDSAIVREVERQMLTGRGYEVEIAVDGADGLMSVQSGGYDLVVSDIDMPRMTGLEFVRALRADPKHQSLPVVIVSYKDRDEDRHRGMEVGANYYLTKSSFHDGKFLAAIEELIGGPDD